MRILGVIPARYAATRLPGKPLITIRGKSMVQRVYEQAKLCKALETILVATDDERIVQHVRNFGGLAIMTSKQHKSGTDRCAEVLNSYPAFDIVINIQGDEPFIDPTQIEEIITCFNDTRTQLATLVKKVNDYKDIFNKQICKVVFNVHREAMYFSRSPIPYLTEYQQKDWPDIHAYYKHIGIYGYRANMLLAIAQLAASSLEGAEKLEQLRWIEHGYTIKVRETHIEIRPIDTPEDLQRIADD